MLGAYLETESRKRYTQIYIAEQLWGINYGLRNDYDYPHLSEMLEGQDGKEMQKARDDETRREVHAWLMGGEE